MEDDNSIIAQAPRHLSLEIVDMADLHRLQVDDSFSVNTVHRPLFTLAEHRPDRHPENVFSRPHLDRHIDPITVTEPLPGGGRVSKVENDIDSLLLYP